MPRAADEEACKLAKEAESKAGWQAYLSERPEGLCAGEARAGLASIDKREDEAACDRARKANSEVAWQEYVRARPNGSCKKEAEKRLAELASAERERLAKLEAERKAAEEEAKKLAVEKERRKRIAKTRDVKQPGSKLYWLRCPVGQRWTGTSCKGKMKFMSWNKAMKACPRGYRLPTRQEFMSLLGGCDADVTSGKYGSCNSCARSGKCRSMFGKGAVGGWSSAGLIIFLGGGFHDGAKYVGSFMCCVRVGP